MAGFKLVSLVRCITIKFIQIRHSIIICVKLELNFYAIDWYKAGIYRFGMINYCRLPSDNSNCEILKDTYCILKLLEVILTALFMIITTNIYFIDLYRKDH